jgi:hypothetical protein
MVFAGESWPKGSGWNQHGYGWKSAWQWSQEWVNIMWVIGPDCTLSNTSRMTWSWYGSWSLRGSQHISTYQLLKIGYGFGTWRFPETVGGYIPRLVKPWLIQRLIYYNAHPLVFIPHVQTQQWLGAPFSARETFSLWPEGWKYQVSDVLQNDGHYNLL